MNRKLVALLLASALVGSMAAGCSAEKEPDDGTQPASGEQSEPEGTQAETDEGTKTLNFGCASSPSGIFLYQFHNDSYNAYITSSIFDSLVTLDVEGLAVPELASSWEISDDERTYTFHLNEGVTWHDGEPFSANDVAFTLNFMASPDYNGFYGSYVSEIEGYDEMQAGTADTLAGVKVIDENTVSVTTKEVYASMMTRIGVIGIMPEHIWKDVDIKTADQETELLRNPVGTGPYKLKEFKQDQYVALTANEDYYAGAPKIDEVNFVSVNSETVQAQLLNGEIDVYPLDMINDDDLAIYEDGGLKVEFYTEYSWQAVQINCQSELLSNKTMRQALACAIDRQGMVDSLLYGYGNVAHSVYAETFWAYPGKENLPIYDYDPERAIELFEEAGLTYDADAKQMLDENGEQVTLRLFVPTGNQVRENAGVVIQANLTEIGFDCQMETMEFATLFDLLGKTDDPGNFDLAVIGYTMGADPDISEIVASDGGTNFCRFYNDQIDELLIQGQQTTDEEERKAIYGELAEILADESPAVYLFNQEGAYVMAPGVSMELNAFDANFHMNEWDIVANE